MGFTVRGRILMRPLPEAFTSACAALTGGRWLVQGRTARLRVVPSSSTGLSTFVSWLGSCVDTLKQSVDLGLDFNKCVE